MKKKRAFTTVSVVVRILLWLLMLVGGSILGIWLDSMLLGDIHHNLLFHIFSFIVGVFLARLAFCAAATGGRELASRGRSENLPRLETDKLVTEGIYSYMRHPMLMGLSLLPLALAFIIGSPSFILVIAPIEALFIAVMVLTLEEMECRAKFGREYEEYAENVPSVCFDRECLEMLFCLRKKRKGERGGYLGT